MKLHIAPESTIAAFQAAFSEAFPGLKLVFFSKAHRAHTGSAAKFMVQSPDMVLSELSPQLKTGYVLAEPDTIVWQLERMLEHEYGLHVQVFRKSGRTWLETSATDDLTLEQQQAKAVSSENVHPEYMDPIDYRDQD